MIISKPDLVGITCTTPTSYSAHNIAKLCEHLLDDAKIIMGGVHPTILPDETLADENVEFVIRGEGEQTMYELVSAMNTNNGFDKIPGLSYKKRGSVVHNPPSPVIDNLDALPFPACAN